MNILQMGFVLVFLGMILLVIGALQNAGKTKTDFAFGGIIGFIPFGFASDPRMFWIMVALLILILILMKAGRFL